MSVATLVKVLSAIPWNEVLKHGPTLLESAKGLFRKSNERHGDETLEERVQRLERIEREQAQLIEQLVERQELILQAVQATTVRLKLLFLCNVAAFIGLVVCLVILAFN